MISAACLSPWPLTLADTTRVPILIFRGAGDQIVPLAATQELQRRFAPNATRIDFPDMGHQPALSHYEQIFASGWEATRSRRKKETFQIGYARFRCRLALVVIRSLDLPGFFGPVVTGERRNREGTGFFGPLRGESAAVVIARRAYSLGLSPLRAR